MPKIKILTDVVDWRLCVGCGACAYICPDDRVKLVDYTAEGIRPILSEGNCGDCTLCLDVCPGVQTDFTPPDGKTYKHPADVPANNKSFSENWGQVMEVWEGYATDPEIRFKGSSGGVLTALAAYCVESANMSGILHIGPDPENPVLNRTRLSTTRAEILAASGSRYSPASVCNGLKLVEQAEKPCAIIGQPSEIAAVANARRLRPELDQKVGLTMSFFCAGSPPTRATTALLEKNGVKQSAVTNLRYRGLGWPGYFAPTRKGETEPAFKQTYADSWAFLQSFRPWSVQVWPDGSGELADISCGDPWYSQPDGINPGASLVLARTERGREILRGAIAAGYVQLTPAEAWKVDGSQAGLWQKKGSVWGRIFAMRLLRLPTTKHPGSALFACWRRLDVNNKLRSTFGTVRRILSRGLRKPLVLSQKDSIPVKPAVKAVELKPKL